MARDSLNSNHSIKYAMLLMQLLNLVCSYCVFIYFREINTYSNEVYFIGGLDNILMFIHMIFRMFSIEMITYKYMYEKNEQNQMEQKQDFKYN